MRHLLPIAGIALLSVVGGGPIRGAAADDPSPFGPPISRPGAPPAPLPRPSSGNPAGAAPSGPPRAPDASGERPFPAAAFSPWLSHEDWLCRALAAAELARRSDAGVVGLLTSALEREREGRVVAILARALTRRAREELLVEGGVALGDRLVPMLRDAHALIRARALAILKVLAPVRLGDRADDYVVWWSKGRDGLALEARLAKERLEAMATGSGSPIPNDTVTVAPLALRKYADLERIHRHGLELVVCLDSTGSMEGVIEAAKRDVRALVERLRLLAPRVRVGLVTYDDAARVRTALTTDARELERELSRVTAAGGDDYEEGVDKAVLFALRQERVAWSAKALRVIVVVGDAPPHDDDVAPLLRAVAKARIDALYEFPVRLDTISTNPVTTGDAEGLVPWFRALATAGGGTALRLAQAKHLAAELVASAFGPSWRDAIGALLTELDAFEAAVEQPKGR